MKFIFFWVILNLMRALAYDPDSMDSVTPPYLVYLKSDYLPCTGVLIHPLWVITSSSCNLPNLKVVLGVTNPSSVSEENVQVVGYEKVINHPHFVITSIENNLMLIKLNKHVEVNDYVKLVSLPKEPVTEDTMCTVSTWAYNMYNVFKDPDSLQNVNISVISKTQCEDVYKRYHVTKHMLCLGIVPGRRLPCREVTAAPAVCNGTLQGILAFVDGCTLRADAGIYTRIFNYVPWIENTIQNN
ncbi:probable inactive serine protease 58 [Molossus molossus]|uniref:Serine protease 58 n=4 Tax=Molossus molossus TaxID=27622 RepID=A0A7J8HD16_MOLMO|nr:probable inactive serine protease 58 [Molossus molossus]KAF6470173.1 serine protease 58 [Molossus molossus]